MSGVLLPGDCENIFSQVHDAARALGVDGVEAIIAAENHALTRFANNAIHQNVAERSGHVSVRAVIDGRTARAATNRLDEASIRDVVAEAVAITRAVERDPDLLPLAAPSAAPATARFFADTASAAPSDRAQVVAEAIAAVREAGQTAAGIYSTAESATALLNSSGVRAYHTETMAQFSITAMAPDSSGWAKASACDRRAIDPPALARTALDKAAKSSAPREVPPGRYTVILEPAAVLDVLGQLFPDFSATAIRDGRSCLKERMGKQVFGRNIHDPRRRLPPRPVRSAVRWRGCCPAASGARGKRRATRDCLQPAGGAPGRRTAYGPRFSAPQ